jgi:hypothetical protein
MKDKILKAINFIFPIFVCAQIAFSVFSYFNGTETRDLLYNFFHLYYIDAFFHHCTDSQDMHPVPDDKAD